MTILRTLAPILAAAVALAAGPAQAEMKNQWVEYSQGGTKLKAYLVYDDKVTGRRPAVLMIHARGHDPEYAVACGDLGQARLRDVRGRHFRLRRGRAAEGCSGNAGADRDLRQGPGADARADPGGVRCPR